MDINSIVRKWLPPITPEDKHTIINTITGTETSYGTPLLRKYIHLLRPYIHLLGIPDNTKEPDCLASGIVFFYGCLCYIMHFPNWGQYIEDILLYNLLYILVDHYIDDNHQDPKIKSIAISQMYILIEDPTTSISFIDPILQTIGSIYYKLITRRPQCKKSIQRLFDAEIQGLKIQQRDDLTRQEYYDIAIKKGGYTMYVLQDIVGNSDPDITKATFDLGRGIQLLDDMNDVLTDQRNGIHTIATHDLNNKNILDTLWKELVLLIDSLDPKFTIFKILYMTFAVYIPDRCKQNFSEELRSWTNSLNLFDYTYGCDASGLLVNTILSELLAIEILN